MFRLSWMTTPELAHVSIADMPEDKLVERLLSNLLWRSELFDLHGMRRGMRNKQRMPLDSAPASFQGDRGLGSTILWDGGTRITRGNEIDQCLRVNPGCLARLNHST